MVYRPGLQAEPAAGVAQDAVSPLSSVANAGAHDPVGRIHHSSRVSLQKKVKSSSIGDGVGEPFLCYYQEELPDGVVLGLPPSLHCLLGPRPLSFSLLPANNADVTL